MKECQTEAIKWGYNELNLHVEPTSLPALALYLAEEFEIISKIYVGSASKGKNPIQQDINVNLKNNRNSNRSSNSDSEYQHEDNNSKTNEYVLFMKKAFWLGIK